MGNCDSYNTCRQKEKENLKYPIDQQSLYYNRIVDNQRTIAFIQTSAIAISGAIANNKIIDN